MIDILRWLRRHKSKEIKRHINDPESTGGTVQDAIGSLVQSDELCMIDHMKPKELREDKSPILGFWTEDPGRVDYGCK